MRFLHYVRARHIGAAAHRFRAKPAGGGRFRFRFRARHLLGARRRRGGVCAPWCFRPVSFAFRARGRALVCFCGRVGALGPSLCSSLLRPSILFSFYFPIFSFHFPIFSFYLLWEPKRAPPRGPGAPAADAALGPPLPSSLLSSSTFFAHGDPRVRECASARADVRVRGCARAGLWDDKAPAADAVLGPQPPQHLLRLRPPCHIPPV